jgi:fructose-1,6-bisphosphatase/inositol monophosphatase family enzyme
LVSLRSCHDWDLAAALLLIREAGAWLSDAGGNALMLNGAEIRHQGLVAAGTKSLYTPLQARLEMIVLS